MRRFSKWEFLLKKAFAPRGSKFFPLRAIPYGIENHFYHIRWPPLNVTIFIAHVRNCEMEATSMSHFYLNLWSSPLLAAISQYCCRNYMRACGCVWNTLRQNMLQSNTHLPNMYKLRNSSFRLCLSIFFFSEGQLYSLLFGVYRRVNPCMSLALNSVRINTIWFLKKSV